jgi:hypothetical protein
MQDSYLGLASCATSCVGRDLVWKFLRTNWTKLVKRFEESSRILICFVEVNFIFLFYLN